MLFLTLLCSFASAVEVTPQKRAEAREHYDAGARKFDIGKFDEAATEFQAAYELIGDPTILYNIAKSYQLGQNPERARFFYQSYLRRMENPPNRAEVVQRISDLNEVLQQQKHLTETPPIGILRPGEQPPHTPEAKPEPPKHAELKPQPKPEQRQPVVEEPKPQPRNPVVEEQKPVVQETPKPPVDRTLLFKGLGFGLAGLTVVGVALGAASSGIAAGASSNISRNASNKTLFTPGLQSTESSGKTFDTVQIVGYVIGGVAAAGAAACLFLAYRPKHNSATAIAPLLSPGNAGLAVSGSF